MTALEKSESPTVHDWRLCSDAVNLIETMVKTNNGWWPGPDGDLIRVVDGSGLLDDAVNELGRAGERYLNGKPLRLSGVGIQSVRAVLEDYEEILAAFPARTMFRCHRLTEKRIHEIHSGKRPANNVEVTAI